MSIADIPLGIAFAMAYYINKVIRKKDLYVLTTGIRALVILSTFIVFLYGNKIFDLFSILVGYFIISWTEDISGQIGGFWIKKFLSEDQYQKGFSLSSMLSMTTYLVSYIMAGLFIEIGIDYAFPVLIVGFTIATFIRSLIKPVSGKVEEEKQHNFRDGLTYIWKNKVLRYIMLQSLIFGLAAGGFLLLIESLVKYKYSSSAFILTSILIIAMVGGIGGSFLSSKIKWNPRGAMMVMVLIQIPVILFIPFAPSYLLILPAVFILMFTNQVHGVFASSTSMKATPSDYIIITKGAHETLALFPSVLSGLILGSIIQFVSIDSAFYYVAIMSVGVVLLIYLGKDIGKIKIEEYNKVV